MTESEGRERKSRIMKNLEKTSFYCSSKFSLNWIRDLGDFLPLQGSALSALTIVRLGWKELRFDIMAFYTLFFLLFHYTYSIVVCNITTECS